MSILTPFAMPRWHPLPAPVSGALPLVSVASLLLLTLAVYLPFIRSGFAGTDSLPLIESTRLAGFGDAVRLFTSPVMAGTAFTDGELVYRPFVSLMFGLEHFVWGYDSVGYHVTNVLLHVFSVALVWTLLRKLGLQWWSSTLGASLFALHPIVVATVPVIARRDSIVPVAAFVTGAALLLYAQEAHGWRRAALLAPSVLLVIVALLSKESTYVAVAMLPVLLVARGLKRGLALPRAFRAAIWAMPFFALAAAAFLGRLSVLGTLGGSRSADPGSLDLYQYGVFAGSFARDLAFPLAGLAPATHRMWFVATVLALIGLTLLLLWLPRGHAAIAAAGGLWVVGFGVLCAVLKILTMGWLAYFALVGVALLVGAGTEGALQRVGQASASSLRYTVARASRGLLLLGLLSFGLSSLLASPLFRAYGQWQVAGELTDRYFAALHDCVISATYTDNVSLQQVPATLNDGRVDTSLLGVTLIEQYTADSALRLMFPTRQLNVHVGSWATFGGELDRLRFSCEHRPNGVELFAHHDP